MTVTELASRRPPTTAWVLGGGGNLGAIQVGMLRAMVDRGERPDLVVACSVGALNALAVAADPTPAGIDVLRDVWMRIRSEVIFPSGRINGPWQLLGRGPGLYPNDGLRAVIRGCAPHPRFEQYPVPFQVVATNWSTGRARWFSHGPVERAVLASAALPGAFPPVQIEGQQYIDGAAVDNVPISRALALGATKVVVFHVGNFEKPRPLPRRPIDVLLGSLSIARNSRFSSDIHAVPDDVELTVLPGIDPGPMKRTDFSKTGLLIERAAAATHAFLDIQSIRHAANDDPPIAGPVGSGPTVLRTATPG